jgi:hypothetical protein
LSVSRRRARTGGAARNAAVVMRRTDFSAFGSLSGMPALNWRVVRNATKRRSKSAAPVRRGD